MILLAVRLQYQREVFLKGSPAAPVSALFLAEFGMEACLWKSYLIGHEQSQ
jgi:hypothetical protein